MSVKKSFLLLFSVVCLQGNMLVAENIYSTIASHALPVYAEFINPHELITNEEGKEEKKEYYDFSIEDLSEYEKHKFAFSILNNHKDIATQKDPEIFHIGYWHDLEFFCGPQNKKKMSFFNSINRTKDVFSEKVLQRMLAQPTTNIKLLKVRQEIVKTIAGDELRMKRLENIFSAYEKRENIFFSYWNQENELNEMLMKDMVYFSIDSLNKSPLALEAWDQFLNVALGFSVLGNLAFIAGGIGVALLSDELGYKIGGPLYVLLGAIGLRGMYDVAKIRFNMKAQIQARLIGVATVLNCMKRAYEAIRGNKVLRKNISCKHIRHLFDAQSKLNPLVKLLSTSTFKGEASWASWAGRVFAAHKMLKEVKDDFAPAFEEFGRIGAYLSIAKLYSEYKDERIRFSFAQYEENAEAPSIKSQNIWFPGLTNDPNMTPEKIVANSVELGGAYDKAQHIILTGPNQGGKSTILKGIISCILLGQTIGIVPAENFSFTPFKKVQTCLDIADSSSEGISHFKAELLRVKRIEEEIADLEPSEFFFRIWDEPLRGTTPPETLGGSAYAAMSCAKKSNCVSIMATHFKMLTQLEGMTEGKFQNYMVHDAWQDEDGQFVYPYTWGLGISHQHIALDLMEKEGLNDSEGLAIAQQFAAQMQA